MKSEESAWPVKSEKKRVTERVAPLLHVTSLVFRLLNHDLELCSSSFTFGNVSLLSFRSLNHDLFTIVDIEALARFIDSDTAQGVPLTILALGITLDGLDACGRCLECDSNRHRIIRHDE